MSGYFRLDTDQMTRTRTKPKPPPLAHRPPASPRVAGAAEVVTCRICGKEVKPGGSKRDRLCVRHYHDFRRHPDRPMVAEPKKVPGKAGSRVRSVIAGDLLGLVDALRGERSRSAWIGEAIQEKARRETAPAETNAG